jgi:HAD superfamily hydrolase (TIGR01484 family)
MMRYAALASDYDGTLAERGQVDEATVAALERLRDAGWRLILVTGREIEGLLEAFPRADLFDRVVAENGALLYCPATRQKRPLSERPPEEFVAALRAKDVAPLAIGRVIVATVHPNEAVVLDTIRELGLALRVILNKGAVMVLPSGVDKASGLQAALVDLGLSPRDVVAVGDAENDQAFLNLCGCSVAVANALPMLKQHADVVTDAACGAGVVELIDRILAEDLRLPRISPEDDRGEDQRSGFSA